MGLSPEMAARRQRGEITLLPHGQVAIAAPPELLTRDTPSPRSGAQTITRLPATVNLVIYAGDDVTFTLLVTDPGGGEADLSDATAEAQIRTRADSPDVAAQFQAVIEGNGVTLTLRTATTAQLPARAVWDCKLTVAGWVTTIVAGSIAVTPRVTRPL